MYTITITVRKSHIRGLITRHIRSLWASEHVCVRVNINNIDKRNNIVSNAGAREYKRAWSSRLKVFWFCCMRQKKKLRFIIIIIYKMGWTRPRALAPYSQ